MHISNIVVVQIINLHNGFGPNTNVETQLITTTAIVQSRHAKIARRGFLP